MVYIFDIGIGEAFRRPGYALAVIPHLVLTSRLPLRTIKEVYAAHVFWAAARELAMLNDSSILTISISEMNQAQARWEHLRPEMIRLEDLITQRFIHPGRVVRKRGRPRSRLACMLHKLGASAPVARNSAG